MNCDIDSPKTEKDDGDGAILYNTLNSKIQECDSLGAFKYKVLKVLCN